MEALKLLAFLLARRAWRRPPGRARKTDVIAALVFGAICVAGLVRLADHRVGDPWDTRHGEELRASFLGDCQQTASHIVDCACVFESVTSEPPYDTPDGFEEFLRLAAATRGRDSWSQLPQLTMAIASCRVVRMS